jgi:hypothetical protein
LHQDPLITESKTWPEGHFSSNDVRNLVLVLLLCFVFSYLRWLKLDSLVWGDPALWLTQGQRAASGEIPYRDFSWSYPPLAVLLLGAMMKLFGVAFAVAQTFADLASLAVVVLGYFLMRSLLPRFLHLPLMACLVAIGGTSLMFFGLFSLLSYIPALQIGAAGFLLLLLGLLSYVRSGKFTAATWLVLAVGAFVGLYTKPETILATCATLGLLAILDRHYWFATKRTKEWFWHYAKVAAVSFAPALLAYLGMGAVAGFRNMELGITGYGLASTACPWWPTGLGIFGALASLGEAAFIASALSLTRRSRFALRFGKTYSYALAGGLAGAVIFLAYVTQTNWELLTGPRSIFDKLWYSAPSTLWSSAVLLPVMWSSIVLWLWLLFRFIRSWGRDLSGAVLTNLVLLTGPVAMSCRGWFNWHLGLTTNVPAICYPFFILLAPYLMWQLLSLAGPGPDLAAGVRGRPGAAVATILLAYALVRVVAGYPSQLSNRPYHNLATEAGNIRLTDAATNSEIYRFVMENSQPSDAVLDLPYGGGMNVATHRLSPVFSTLFVQLRMPDDLLERDLDRIRAHPPKIVIAENKPDYFVSYGLEGCTCAFPKVVWVPPTSSLVLGKVFPAVRYIQENYRVQKTIGSKILLVPK